MLQSSENADFVGFRLSDSLTRSSISGLKRKQAKRRFFKTNASNNALEESATSKGGLMLLFLPVNLKDVHEKGRDYPWKKPSMCISCGSCRVWGHGFVWVYFDEIRGGVLLKRYRCPDCRTVYRCRPTGYFKRFQAAIDTIQESVVTRAARGRWLPKISRTRQRHWYRALIRRIAAYLGATWPGGVVGGFVALMSRGLTPVARRI